MDEVWRYTLVENDTNATFMIKFDDVTHQLEASSPRTILRWNSFTPRDTGLPLVTLMIGRVELNSIFSNCDFRENVQITIFRDVANSYSCRMIPRTALSNLKHNLWLSFNYICSESIWDVVKDHLRRMEDLQRNVRIWHNQCTYLFKKFQEGMEQVERSDLVLQTVVDVDLETCYRRIFQNSFGQSTSSFTHALDVFMLPTLMRSMYEGEALLRSCGALSYNKVALACLQYHLLYQRFQNLP